MLGQFIAIHNVKRIPQQMQNVSNNWITNIRKKMCTNVLEKFPSMSLIIHKQLVYRDIENILVSMFWVSSLD